MRNKLRILSVQLAVLAMCVAPGWAQTDDWHGRHGGNPGTAAGRPPGPPQGSAPPPGRAGASGERSPNPGYRPPPNLGYRPPPNPGYRPAPGPAYRPPPGSGYRPGFAGGYRPYPGPDSWRTGAWRRDWHEGRFGWWWTVGPGWYAFDTPVYPYPAYAAPVEVVPPPTIVLQPPPPIVVQPPPPGPAPTQFWYFCQNPPGYFPYVSSCNGNWQEVSANPTR